MTRAAPFCDKFISNALRLIPVACISCATFPTFAFAETTSGVSVSASTGFDTNPFLSISDDAEVASFRLEVAPSASYSDGVTSINLQTRAEHVEYLGKFGSEQNLSTSVTGQHRLNARTTVAANFGLASTESQSDFVEFQNIPGQPLNPSLPDVLVDDITLLGTQTRRTAVTAGGSIVYLPSQLDEISFSSDLNLQRYADNSGLDDYDFVSQRLSYSRVLSQFVSVGGMLEHSVSNFKNTQFGDATILSPSLLVKAQLNSRISLNSTLGASFTSVNTPQGELNVTALAGSASLCYVGARNNFCLNGQRQTVPTALDGVRTITSIGASYSVKLSSRDTFQSGASYSRASAPITGGTTNLESLRIFGRLERQLNERARIFVSGAYSNSSDTLATRRSNIQGQLGITIRYGKR